ncbi:MAG: hypothetical protein WBF33_11300 [Candidatus Nitrosopolaris sp.]
MPATKHYMGPDIPLWATPKYTPPDHRIITYKTGFEAGLNATVDIIDNCNDVPAPQDNQTSCVNGYVAGYDITCHIGIAKVRSGSCPYGNNIQ